MARPDGSIAEALVVDEAVTFLSRYVSELETRFSEPGCNWDILVPNHQLDVFRSFVRPLGVASIQLLRGWKNTIRLYIFNNYVNDIQEYLSPKLSPRPSHLQPSQALLRL